MSRWLTTFYVALRSLTLGRRADRELDAEMQFHLDREIEERVRAGLSPAAARRAALLEMGAMESSKEECRDVRKGRTGVFLAGVVQDLRFALRLFRKNAVPVGITIAGLAVAIGVVTSVFGLINVLMLRPYGMADPGSVVSVTRPPDGPWPYTDFLQMHGQSTLAAVEASVYARVRFGLTPTDDADTRAGIFFVSGGYLRMLGARPTLGRTLEPADDVPGAAPVTVVSHHLWSIRLNSDPAVVGKTVWLNGAPATVVGVLQPEFTGPTDYPPALWVSIASYGGLRVGPAFDSNSKGRVEVVARLAPTASLQAAQEQLTAIVAQSKGSAPASASGPPRVRLYRATSPLDGPDADDRYMGIAAMFAIVGLVLALACANAANLLLAGAATRMREIGVRLALGSTRGRLLRQMVTESLLLGLIAGGLGLMFAIWLAPVLATLIDVPPGVSLAPDTRVLLFTVAVAVACGLGAGISPARYGTRGDVLSALKDQSGGTRSRLRMSFVGFQAAVSIFMLVAAALLVRTAITVTRADTGFDAEKVIAVSLDGWGVSIPAGFDEAQYFDAALAAVRTVPSVERASVSEHRPFGTFSYGGRSLTLRTDLADAEFLSTLGLRLVRGRGFTAEEVTGQASVAVISERAAYAFFQGADPIGQSLSTQDIQAYYPQLRLSTSSVMVVGVVADALLGNAGDSAGTAIRPLPPKSPPPSRPRSLMIRSPRPGLAGREVEEALRRIDPRVRPVTSMIREQIDEYQHAMARGAWVAAPIGILAVVLAVLGVYGVTAFAVSQRTKEVSVRMAMGASATDVLRLLVKDTLWPVVIGLGVGLVLALVASQLLGRNLGLINKHDPLSIGGAVSMLLICALVAVVVPARRVLRANPSTLLREV